MPRKPADKDTEDAIERGLAAQRGGRLDAAAAHYRTALASDPENADGLQLLGLVRHQQGDHGAAIDLLERAAAAAPTDPGLLSNLGLVLSAAGRADAAAAAFRRALAGDPDNPGLLNSLGVALRQAGRADEAGAALQRAVEIDPGFAGAHYNLGNLALAAGDFAGALAAYERTLDLDPGDGRVLVNRAVALKGLGRFDEAEAVLAAAAGARPDDAAVPNNLGNLYRQQKRFPEAITAYEQALALEPGNADAHYNLGAALRDRGETAPALHHFAISRRHRPGFVKARWAALLSLPVIYGHMDQIAEYRDAWLAGLAELDASLRLETATEIAEAIAAVAEMTAFQLPYQGRDDRQPMARYGALVGRIVGAAYPEFIDPPAPRRRLDGRLTVAVISPHFRDHTVWRLFSGWLRGLDRERFFVVGVMTAAQTDAVTLEAAAICDAFIQAPGDAGGLARTVRDLGAQVALHLDVGMDPLGQVLATMRLAPVQAVAWGHPVTTGLPAIDWFLSSDAMEPAGGDAHYSERLCRLPGLSIDYARPAVDPYPAPPAGAPLFLCSQSLFKLLPGQDALFAGIAAAAGPCTMRFIGHGAEPVTRAFRARLAAAFKARGLDADSIIEILPRMDRAAFLAAHGPAHVVLDGVHWSGGNTSLEAVGLGLPVVTRPGAMMRSRHGAAILERAGAPGLIAGSPEEYVEIAVRLARDDAANRALRAGLIAGHENLFGDRQPVRALERFLAEAAGGC